MIRVLNPKKRLGVGLGILEEFGTPEKCEIRGNLGNRRNMRQSERKKSSLSVVLQVAKDYALYQFRSILSLLDWCRR
jgi:hypothetical protein